MGLNAERAYTVCYVAGHHVANARGWSRGLVAVFRFSREAVLIFFLLIGFVIFANKRERALWPSSYSRRLSRRMHSVLLLAVPISTLVVLDNGDLAAQFHACGFIATLASLQDIAFLRPGVIANSDLGSDPLRSR